MTRKEAYRQNHQAHELMALGFTGEEAEALRRISLTLHRWAEHECNGDIERDGDDGDGRPFRSHAAMGGKHLAYPVPDRERGALRRLASIMAKYPHLTAYHQGDPRGAALYILRPGDVPEGKHADAYYNRGVCVY